MTKNQDKYPYAEMGRELKRLRGDISQKLFAEQLCVSAETYNRYEKGHKKIPDRLLRFASLLKQEACAPAFNLGTNDRDLSCDLIGLAKIYGSKDDILIRAIQANIAAFCRTVRAGQDVELIKSENKELRGEIDILKNSLTELRRIVSEMQQKNAAEEASNFAESSEKKAV